jgi:hypothetical protein
MQSQENEEVTDGRKDDDLTIINGIGPSGAEALRKIGIRSFADLARYSPQSLSVELIDGADFKISSKKIEHQNWIGQANALTHSSSLEPPDIDEQEEEEGDSPSSSWHQQAGFSLFFDHSDEAPEAEAWRTRVYHDETGEVTEFLTVDTTTWVNWILDQVKLPLPGQSIATRKISEMDTIPIETPQAKQLQAPTPDELSQPQTEADDMVHFEIQEVTVSVSQPSTGMPEKRIMVAVDFRLAGSGAKYMLDEQVPYRVEIHTVNLQNKDLSLVTSERGHLQPGVYEYRSLQNFSIPELGRYELNSMVILLPPIGKMSYFCGPIFKVVP